MAECSGGSARVSQENSSETNELTMEATERKPSASEGSEEELYEVEKIVGTTKINGRLLYKVRWRGYSANWDTFEPVENLQTCFDLIDEFKSKKEEMKEKRTLERKKRKALMEGRSLPEPVEIVPTALPPPPRVVIDSGDTLKDTFWRDLEQGKVNLFETDMYSKVKGQGRASRPTSFKPKGSGKKNDTGDDKLQSKKTVGKKKRKGGKRQKNKVNQKNCKGKTETAFDRAQLNCHNGINTPESLCSGSSSRCSLFYADVYNGQKVKSPVSLNSELLVKVERIQMNQDSNSPVSVKTENTSFTNIISKEDISPDGQTSEEKHLSSTSESVEQPCCSKIEQCEESSTIPAAMISIPKRPMINCEEENGKKMRTSDSEISDHFTCTSASPEKGADQSYPHQAINKANSASVISPCLTSDEGPQMDISATELSINPPLTSPPYIDKADLPCIQSTISEGSDLETSCRGDKFSETSPPTDSGEEFTKGEEESNTYTVGLLGTVVELDQIEPDKYDEQEVGISDNEDSTEISERKFQDAVAEGLYEKVKKALDSGKSYNMGGIDATGMTLLMFAAQRGYDDIAELLVKHGARINSQQRNGTTALMLSCEHSQLCSVVLMVELGANLNLQLTSGETALMKAVKRGNKQIVRFLLERGANFASQTITGNSAMTYAKMLHVCDVEDILFDHVARLTAEFDRQVSVTINNTAKIMCALFPLQCFPLCDGNKFVIHFKHELQHITPGVGYLLFIAHTRITPQEIKCRFYGPCAVSNVMLNGVVQPSLTEEANFVLSCCPLNNGKNELIINAVTSPSSKSKLVVCAYKAKMLE